MPAATADASPGTDSATGTGNSAQARDAMPITLFLCGDVMLGRGIDQVLPHPSDPVLYEAYVRDARRYVELAERRAGAIARPVPFAYVWGDALAELSRRGPAARIVNLETSVTRSATPWPGKGIHYRMDPGNLPCLTAADVDCCVLANNHVLDWRRAGLTETLAALGRAGIAVAGAGRDSAAAQAPAVLTLAPGRRLLVFAAATGDSGVPGRWAAGASRSGVQRLPGLSPQAIATVTAAVNRHRRDGDLVVFSIHWGDNWGYDVPAQQREFAHALVEDAGVDVVHGHSSHHAKAIEVHRDRLVLYGCGDFINDYEGIEGHEDFRGDLGLMYFPTLDAASGRLLRLDLVPTRIHRLRVNHAPHEDRLWLLARLRRECGRFGVRVDDPDGRAFAVRWGAPPSPPRRHTRE